MTLFSEAIEVLEQAVAQRVFPGAAFGVLRLGETAGVATGSQESHAEATIELGAAGRFTYEADAPAVQEETVFDVASLTKVMATTALAMRMWQDDRLQLDMPLIDLLPAFAGNDTERRKVTLGMLLSHTAGLPAHVRLYESKAVAESSSKQEAAAAALRLCLELPLETMPGTKAVYSDIGFILLGRALGQALTQAHGGESFDEHAGDGRAGFGDYVAREVFTPLGMANTGFLPPPEMHSRIAPTCDWRWRHRCLQGEVQDENCALLGSVAGHAGVFSTVPDVLRFADAVLRRGAIFHSRTIDKFSRRVAGSRALGWDTPSLPSQSGSFFSERTIGHLGYTGTSLWIDRERNIAVALLTNRVYTGQDAPPLSDRYAIQRVRPAFHDAVMRKLLGLQ